LSSSVGASASFTALFGAGTQAPLPVAAAVEALWGGDQLLLYSGAPAPVAAGLDAPLDGSGVINISGSFDQGASSVGVGGGGSVGTAGAGLPTPLASFVRGSSFGAPALPVSRQLFPVSPSGGVGLGVGIMDDGTVLCVRFSVPSWACFPSQWVCDDRGSLRALVCTLLAEVIPSCSLDAALRAVMDTILLLLGRASAEIDRVLSATDDAASLLDRAGGVVAVRGCVTLLPLADSTLPLPQDDPVRVLRCVLPDGSFRLSSFCVRMV
jgi:hypothetical protein